MVPPITSEYLREEDLLNSIVVDSEGYVCGWVDSFEVEPDRILVHLYGIEKRRVKSPDEEKLVKKLIDVLSSGRGFLGRRSPIEELHNRIREELDLPPSHPITLKELIRFAGMRGVTIPVKTEEVEERVEQGSVDWNLIEKIGVSELGKCILLREPIEAERRGVEITEKVPYRGTDFLKGRTVIDSEARIVGSAKKFLLRIGAPPGLLIQLEKVKRTELPDLDGLISSLVPSRFKSERDLYRTVAKDLNLKGRFTSSEVKSRYLIPWAESKGIQIPRRIEERREVTRELPVDWSCIKKIGDIILLKETIEELTKPEKPARKVEEEIPLKEVEEAREVPEAPREVEEEEEEEAEEAVEEEREEYLRDEWWREYLTSEE